MALTLPKCTLCDNTSDPRWGIYVDGQPYALCDGCGPEGTEDTLRVARLCKATGKPSEGGYPRFWASVTLAAEPPG